MSTPVPGSPEHNAAMIALAESTNAQIFVSDSSGRRDLSVTPAAAEPAAAAKPVRPDNVPEKFWNAETGVVNTEALLKSYTELERTRTAPAAKPAVAPVVPPVVGPTAEQTAAAAALAAATTDEAKAAAQAQVTAADAAATAATAAAAAAAEAAAKVTPTATLNDAMQLAAESFTATGDISEEAFVALEANGITREYATQYATGLKAQAELVEVKMYAEVGGKDQYTALHAWAETSLSAEQKQAYNAALNGSLEVTLGSVRNLKALYEAANGRAPTTRVEPEGGSERVTQKEMFRSEAEVTAAMADPKYRTDPAFRQQVADKIVAASNAGIELLRVSVSG